MSFKLEEIREIVGEAYTDEMGRKLAKLHRTVVDPLMDQLDEAKSEAQRYKAKADKATDPVFLPGEFHGHRSLAG